MFSILYVDDEPGLLELGKIFLERMGNLTVETAPSAHDAISKLSIHKFDCIVSDYQMPQMDGLQFLKYVRETWNTLPFILFTGKGREEVVIEALNNGADFYLQKGGEPRSQFAELEHKIRVAVEKRKFEEKLSDSERRFSDIINFLPDPTFAVDLDGKVISWNKAIEELTGVSQDKVIGTGDYSYSQHVLGEKKPVLLDLILKKNHDPATEYAYLTREGDKLIAERFIQSLNGGKGAYVWLIASPLYDSDGNITGAIESLRDITARKKAEDELRASYEQLTAAEEELRQQYLDLAQSDSLIRESERRLADIINFLPDATFAIDQKGVVIAWNKAMEEITGVPGSRIIGTGDYSYAVPIWGKKQSILIDSVLKEEYDVGQLYPSVTRKDGKLIAEAFAPGLYGGKGAYIWFIASPLYDTSGSVTGAIESIRDVTERKIAHDELMEAYEHLAETGEKLQRQFEDLTWSEARIHEDERFIRDVFSSIQDGIAILDRDLNIVQVNDAMDCLVSDSGLIIGKKCYEVYHQRDIPCDECPALYTLKTGFPDHKSITRSSDRDSPGSLEVYTYPMYDSDAGKITGVIEYVRGICNLKNSSGI